MNLRIDGKPLETLSTSEIAFSLREIEDELEKRRKQARLDLAQHNSILNWIRKLFCRVLY